MFKGHPKGLYVAFFTNMGERFGFYTMIAIFTLFLQAKYGISSTQLGLVYGLFMAFLYFFPLVGGLMADKVLGYGRTISIGIIVMFLGYLLLSIPSGHGAGFGFIVAALAVIVIGTGLFKGNLQALVGNLYDDPKYSSIRDRAFNIFYMGINIGAMFAPTAAELVSNGILKTYHYTYDARIPALANDLLKGNLQDPSSYLGIAQAQDPSVTVSTLQQFSTSYLDALGRSYHWAFSVACVSLLISMLVFWIFRKHYKQADLTEKQKARSEAYKSQVVELTQKQIRERLIALFLVFFVVIFFWMSFQQNGLCMTIFARDYTQPTVGRFTNLFFDLFALLPIFLSVIGFIFLVKKSSKPTARIIGGIVFIAFAVIAVFRYLGYNDINPFTPQKFQHFNPFFIVALTPLVIGLFSWLGKKGKEPSSPRKIGIGMLITAVAFTILIFASIGIPSPKQLGGHVAPANLLVSPYYLIVTYFILTVAELFLSPMGISFVSKVAPPKYKGTMQGFWFAATGIGNFLLFVGAWLWGILPLWGLWLVLVVCCLLSAGFIFSVMKRLERTSESV
ncbi:MAG TPA: peptide MFS transporter [Bacteroidales bacterium]|nr:peptide MFS transporter [Bacteroidales bacterium]